MPESINQRPKVVIRHGKDVDELSRDALSEAVTLDLRGKRVLIKPNIGFKASPKSGVVTNPEVVAGAIRWAREAGAGKILVGDSCIYGVNSEEAFVSSGIKDAAENEGAEVVYLDKAKPIVRKVPDPVILENIRISSPAHEADIIVSVPVVKSHMHTGATLSLKNMKGVLYRREKMKMHHLAHPDETGPLGGWHTLDLAISDVLKAIPPHVALLDATVVLEGMGPMIGDPRCLDTLIASEDPLGADLAGLELIGFEPWQVPHILLSALRRNGPKVSLEDFDLDRKLLSRLRTPIKPAIPEDISSTYPYFVLTSVNGCSACDSTVMAFLKTYGEAYSGVKEVQIALGKGIREADIRCDKFILLGNCVAGLKNKGCFIKGCPPIPSDVKQAIDELV